MSAPVRKARLAAAIAWRWIWAIEDRVRGLVWGEERGFDLRPRPAAVVSVITPHLAGSSSGSVRMPRSSCLGMVAAPDAERSRAVLEEVGHFYGLDVYRAAPEYATPVIDCAVRERWPLLGVSLQGLKSVPPPWPVLLRTYVARGGTLLLNGITAESARCLNTLAEAFEISFPIGLKLDAADGEVLFSARDLTFAGELAGVGIRSAECDSALTDCEGAETLVSIRSGERIVPAVSLLRRGQGTVVLCAGGQQVTRLADGVAQLQALTVLPAMMLVRQVYGEAAWRAPAPFANFIVDDPALRNGSLGLDYPRVLALAREHDFHLTVATVPRELEVAESEVVQLLVRNGRHLSACYHGSDHSGYEFYLPDAKESRHRARSISSQQAALRLAVARGQRFAERTGLALDRVMVFPHGVGTPEIFPTLQTLGFIATCNYDDRYPLGSTPPEDYDLGMRAADLAWSGFPLIWRRGIPDPMFRLDLFLGRPAITFGHIKALGADLAPFVRRAEELRDLRGGIKWAGLEDIARHSYMQRHDPEHGWQVLMLSNEICLHNPESHARTYHVERANILAGWGLVADSPHTVPSGPLTLTVPPGGSRTVRLAAPGTRSLSPGQPCSLLRGTNAQSMPRMEATNH
jgi:hypothetical protein